MKLIWHSNAPWSPTGYGTQTALFLPHLKGSYDVACSAFYGLEGNVLPWQGIPVFPGIGVTHGNETILDHAGMFFDDRREGLVATLMDVWVLDPVVWRQLNTVCWTPIDHQPVPPPIVGFFRGSGAIPLAMSKFGRDELKDAGLDPLYCPHAVDCSVYRPIDRDEAREQTNLPKDAFIVGMVAANKGNPSRKCFHEAFQAFKLFHARHPEARLYIHTEAMGRFDGVNLPELMDAVGLDRDLALFCDQYRVVHYPFPHETMAAVYSSFDVLLSASAGEGFGLAPLEAQACGVPVIASDFSAQPEVCGAGWLVSGRSVYTPLKSWQFLPDVEDIADALRQAYHAAGNKGIAEKARKHAEQYHIEHVAEEHMLPALEEAAERFQDREPVAVAA